VAVTENRHAIESFVLVAFLSDVMLTTDVSNRFQNTVITPGPDNINQINGVTRGELFDTMVIIPVKMQRIYNVNYGRLEQTRFPKNQRSGCGW
jgi:hypothetical protein